MRGAGLATMAWGGWCKFAGIGSSGGAQDSSSHGDNDVTPAAASSGTRQSKCIFFNLRGRQGCQDCKRQI